MTDQRKAGGWPPGDMCGPALPGANGAGTAGANVGDEPTYPSIRVDRAFCQVPSDLAGLAREAERRAAAAGLLAQACGLAGDAQGRAYWLRRRALHLSVLWGCAHPEPQEVTR